MNSRSAASVAPRLVTAVALGAALVIGMTGCTFMTHQATTIDYPASDGVNVASTGGPVQVRNALIIADENGERGNLVAYLHNDSDKSATLTVKIAGETLTVKVPAGEPVSLGVTEDPLEIERLDTIPGATIEVLFQSGTDTEAEPLLVPVLDGTEPHYADLVPSE